MGEHICFRRNERLATVNPHWRGNPVVRGKFVNRQHRFRPGMGSVLKWRLSPNPQRKEKKSVKWSPKLNYLRSLDGVVGNSLIWLGHNSFFLQLGRKRIMFDPVFGDIPFVKRQSDFPANPDIFTDIDYLLISHDHFDHLDKQSVARLVKNNPGMKLFCGLGTGELIKGWFPELEVTEAGWYQQIEDDGLKITFLPAQHWSKRSVRDGGRSKGEQEGGSESKNEIQENASRNTAKMKKDEKETVPSEAAETDEETSNENVKSELSEEDRAIYREESDMRKAERRVRESRDTAGNSDSEKVTETENNTQSEETSAGGTTYIIRPGDTLYQISVEKYGSMEAVAEICRVNNMSESETIYPGQIIVLP